MSIMTRDNKYIPRHIGKGQCELIGDIFIDRQEVVTRDEKYPDFQISDWVLRTIDVTSIGKRDKEIVSEGICIRCWVSNRDVTVRGDRMSLTSLWSTFGTGLLIHNLWYKCKWLEWTRVGTCHTKMGKSEWWLLQGDFTSRLDAWVWMMVSLD